MMFLTVQEHARVPFTVTHFQFLCTHDVSFTDVLFNLALQAANMTMQPSQYLWLQTQLTSQEMMHNANNGCILQTEIG